eukprot:scaffold262125_cov18-Prasinocladus_malaysianus.AAC.1
MPKRHVPLEIGHLHVRDLHHYATESWTIDMKDRHNPLVRSAASLPVCQVGPIHIMQYKSDCLHDALTRLGAQSSCRIASMSTVDDMRKRSQTTAAHTI